MLWILFVFLASSADVLMEEHRSADVKHCAHSHGCGGMSSNHLRRLKPSTYGVSFRTTEIANKTNRSGSDGRNSFGVDGSDMGEVGSAGQQSSSEFRSAGSDTSSSSSGSDDSFGFANRGNAVNMQEPGTWGSKGGRVDTSSIESDESNGDSGGSSSFGLTIGGSRGYPSDLGDTYPGDNTVVAGSSAGETEAINVFMEDDSTGSGGIIGTDVSSGSGGSAGRGFSRPIAGDESGFSGPVLLDWGLIIIILLLCINGCLLLIACKQGWIDPCSRPISNEMRGTEPVEVPSARTQTFPGGVRTMNVSVPSANLQGEYVQPIQPMSAIEAITMLSGGQPTIIRHPLSRPASYQTVPSYQNVPSCQSVPSVQSVPSFQAVPPTPCYAGTQPSRTQTFGAVPTCSTPLPTYTTVPRAGEYLASLPTTTAGTGFVYPSQPQQPPEGAAQPRPSEVGSLPSSSKNLGVVQARDAFDLIDTNRDGVISRSEFEKLVTGCTSTVRT